MTESVPLPKAITNRVNKSLHLGLPYENPDRLLVGGGVYRRLVYYRGRSVGWIAYGVSMDPERVSLWMQTYRGAGYVPRVYDEGISLLKT